MLRRCQPRRCQPWFLRYRGQDREGNKTPGFLFLVELGGGVMAPFLKCLHDQEDLHLISRTHVMPSMMVGVCFLSQHGSQREEIL